jgi:hypothetical protein
MWCSVSREFCCSKGQGRGGLCGGSGLLVPILITKLVDVIQIDGEGTRREEAAGGGAGRAAGRRCGGGSGATEATPTASFAAQAAALSDQMA